MSEVVLAVDLGAGSLVSHSMADIVGIATRVAVLENGSKIADLPVDGLAAADLAHRAMIGQRLRAA